MLLTEAQLDGCCTRAEEMGGSDELSGTLLKAKGACADAVTYFDNLVNAGDKKKNPMWPSYKKLRDLQYAIRGLDDFRVKEVSAALNYLQGIFVSGACDSIRSIFTSSQFERGDASTFRSWVETATNAFTEFGQGELVPMHHWKLQRSSLVGIGSTRVRAHVSQGCP